MTTPAFSTILVPLDGSTTAEQALPVAATIAHRSGATLRLVTAQMPTLALAANTGAPVIDREFDRELRAQRAAYLKSAADAIMTTHGVEATCEVLDSAESSATALAEHARATHASLIVMTTHGHGTVNRRWLGSVTDRLLRQVETPVLLLHPTDGAPHTAFRHIVVALDGSAESEHTLEPAIALGSLAPDTHYFLVQVVEPPLPFLTRLAMHPAHLQPQWQEQREAGARAYLERIAERLRGQQLAVTTKVVAARGVGDRLLEVAQQVDADLVAVGTHGARGLEHLLLGSVADKVVRGATDAVLVVPTRRERA